MSGVYIHIPLCKSKCIYCDFYSVTSDEKTEILVESLLKEIKLRKKYLDGTKVKTIYIGGGTPSLLSVDDIEKIILTVKDNFCMDGNDIEVTMEANPDDLTESYLENLKRTDVNRLSIGIQSLDDDELKLLRRRHNSDTARNAIRNAKKFGFNNISLDLMFGLPGQTKELWKDTLDEIVDFHPEHISAYSLEIHSGAVLSKMVCNKSIELPETDTLLEMYNILSDTLRNAEYEHYEISNYARKGFRSRHNSGYWNGTKYLGIGPGAHSYNGDSREFVLTDLKRYIKETELGNIPTEKEILSKADKYNEYVMTRLRTCEGVDTKDIENLFGREMETYFRRCAEMSVKAGTLENVGHIYRIPEESMMLSDIVMSDVMKV